MLTVYQDTDWWAVWVGRHALENLTSVPKGQLKWFSTPLETVRGKAGLTWIRTIRIDDAKAGPNDRNNRFSVGGRLQKSYLGKGPFSTRGTRARSH